MVVVATHHQLMAPSCLQGLAMGGEFGAAIVYISEMAGVGHRIMYTALLQAAANVGLLLAVSLIMVLQATISSGGWGPHSVGVGGVARGCKQAANATLCSARLSCCAPALLHLMAQGWSACLAWMGQIGTAGLWRKRRLHRPPLI